MYRKTIIVQNKTGLHARPASMLTQFCKKFSEEIRFVVNNNSINPKSIIALLSGGLKKGTEFEIQVTGENEEAVCLEIAAFIENLNE